MFRRVRFECGACAAGFVDWHDEEWERSPVFCVNCGKPIAAGTAVDLDEDSEPRKRDAASSLGFLKPSGDGFPDTLPGLRAVSADTGRTGTHSRDGVRATSSAPRGRPNAAPFVLPESRTRKRRPKLAALGALLLGFSAGVPLTLLAQGPLARHFQPPAQLREAELTRRLATAASALDDGEWARARTVLHGLSSALPADRRVATLRARLALSLVIANRPDEARRELSAVPDLPGLHPAVVELRRLYDAMLTAQRSAVAGNAAAPLPAPAVPSARVPAPPVRVAALVPPPSVSRQALLAAARAEQRRSRLDDAQRLYEAVLKLRPDDSEARCGLAEVQLLRGSVLDAEALFERALRVNANYVPAWVALADIDWLRGRPERAACRYQLVVDRFPEGSYPPYVAQRIARVLGSGAMLPAADSCGI